MTERVFHNKWFFYEDPKSGKILKAKYETYVSSYATLIVKAPYMTKKWSLFGFEFGGLVERYQVIFDSRVRDYGPVINISETYDVGITTNRMRACMYDWENLTGGFQKEEVVHSEYLGNKKIMREKRIDELL